jgi:cation:H+ antiporter
VRQFFLATINSLDILCWLLVFLFFSSSALLTDGDILRATSGAAAIIVDMMIIAIAVEIIIECLKNSKGIGTLTGFITNGPEAVCLIVGLLVGDIIFAASTPLGSNFMNPLLLFIAAVISGHTARTFQTKTLYTVITISIAAGLAGSFFLMPPTRYLLWLVLAVSLTLPLFILRPTEPPMENEEHTLQPAVWLLPAIVVLTIGGYFLDPVVSYAARYSNAPKGLIGFLVLAFLTSWPEFKSCISLLKRKKYLAAVLNITISNLTNIWLAAIGICSYLLWA